MKFDYVTNYWMETATEDELRATASEMRTVLGEIDYYSEEHTRISNVYVDVVNAIFDRFPNNQPRREHGWYLQNDD